MGPHIKCILLQIRREQQGFHGIRPQLSDRLAQLRGTLGRSTVPKFGSQAAAVDTWSRCDIEVCLGPDGAD